MTIEYTFRTVDIKTNKVLEDIDLQGVTFSIKLSGVGDLSGTLYAPDSVKGSLLDAATTPGRTGLYVLRNGIPVWGGIIWKRSWDETKMSYLLTCGSWESYAYHILQLNDLSYSNVDQYAIARDILARNGVDAESQITWPTFGISGMRRDRNMYMYEYKTVGLELEQLAGLEKGFDYHVESYIKDDGSFGRRYTFGYPRLGRAAGLDLPTSLTLDYPGDLEPFTLNEDAESSATSVFALGKGDGVSMIVAQAGDGSIQVGVTPDPTVAAALIQQRYSINELIFDSNWTWGGAPDVVLREGPYLRDLAAKDGITMDSKRQPGVVPDATQAAQLILDRFNSGFEIYEDWTWYNNPAIVSANNDMLVSLFYNANPGSNYPSNIPAIKTWLIDYINRHPALNDPNAQDRQPAITWLNTYIAGHPASKNFNPASDTPYGGWPRLDVVTSYKDVSVLNTLQQHANVDYSDSTPPINSWNFELSPGSDVEWPDIQIGDSAVFRLISRRWPTPFVMVRRISQISVSIGEEGAVEQVTLGLEEDPS